ncbi:phosphate-starvation-inducible PsiE family protein [Convivina intestini]|uniref:phosphate-starvation-inducible PsiE family protein n=1 Tax=Convivina intestini TaxID=1505726 RepID=UPI00200D0B19|nr:phosphate-starvation-inducible PsiE family protein [Convivina intestini]CAH1853241.1 Protein PsiE [Convivina intestini]
MKEKIYTIFAKFYEYTIMTFMMIFGLVILGYFGLSIYELGMALFEFKGDIEITDITKTVLSAFLCFEFAVIIKEYFENKAAINFENYLYVAVTAMIRSILVYHDNATKTISLCIAIFILMVAIILYRKFYKQH